MKYEFNPTEKALQRVTPEGAVPLACQVIGEVKNLDPFPFANLPGMPDILDALAVRLTAMQDELYALRDAEIMRNRAVKDVEEMALESKAA